MPRNIKPKRPLLLTAAVAAAVTIGGCASSRHDDPFAAGSGRSPTPSTLHMMSRLLLDKNEVDKAEFVLRRVLADNPVYLPAQVELAELLAREQRTDEAIGLLEQAILTVDNDPVLHNNLGVLRMQSHDYAGANSAFRRATELDPREARYWSNYGITLTLTGAPEDAAQAFARAVAPDDAIRNVGHVLLGQGFTEQADLAFQAADGYRRPVKRDRQFATVPTEPSTADQ